MGVGKVQRRRLLSIGVTPFLFLPGGILLEHLLHVDANCEHLLHLFIDFLVLGIDAFLLCDDLIVFNREGLIED